MNPAYSIIFFTAASGAGYGLIALLGLYAWLGMLPASRGLAAAALLLSLALVTAGLLSSTFHLGHPERAWRALSQWRSSWLSREGVMAIVTYVPVLLFGFGWVALGEPGGTFGWMGLLGGLGAVLTVLCTGMIYASLKAIPSWYNPWVPVVYLALGLMSGALWLSFLARALDAPLAGASEAAVLLVVVAAGCKLAYWAALRRRGRLSSVASATGMPTLGGRPATVTLLDPPHTEPNYLQREMGYMVARRHAERLREHTALLAFALPLMLSLGALGFDGGLGIAASGLAALLGSAGVVLERWLFFAEAEHKVTLYYGAAAV